MARLTKQEREKEELKKIQYNFFNWKDKWDSYLEIIGLTNRNKTQKRKEIIEKLYLVRDNKGDLIISGGGRILLFLVADSGLSWRQYLLKLLKKKRYDLYFEIKKFRHREKLFEINLLKHFKKNPMLILKDNGGF
jgi:hypothetical protein